MRLITFNLTTETLLSNKADKATGEIGLSTNDFIILFKQALNWGVKRFKIFLSTDILIKTCCKLYRWNKTKVSPNLNRNDIVTDVHARGGALDATTNVLITTTQTVGWD